MISAKAKRAELLHNICFYDTRSTQDYKLFIVQYCLLAKNLLHVFRRNAAFPQPSLLAFCPLKTTIHTIVIYLLSLINK